VTTDATPAVEARPPDLATAGLDTATGDPCPAPPQPTGATIELAPGGTLAAALAKAHPGDRVLVHGGSYPVQEVSTCRFAGDVFIEAAAGETPTFAGITLHACDHLAFRGVHAAGTVRLDGASHIAFRGVTLDAGTSDGAALEIHGQGGNGASHDVEVTGSTIKGGGRTVFILGRFAPTDTWNHDLRFQDDDLTCGSHVCFQLSGARDTLIEGNRIHGTVGTGVLTAGATRIQIARNRMTGAAGMSGAAVQLASPGMEWDNYDGVENMISSAIVVANNVITGWGTGVQLDAARDIAVVFDTVVGGTGVRLNHRTPHDRKGNVILDANQNVRVWNDVLPSISIATGETRPAFEATNLVGGAAGLDADLTPTAGGTAADRGTMNAETPVVDLEGRARDGHPDIGARERGAPALPACP
jgi:hypothetical protein